MTDLDLPIPIISEQTRVKERHPMVSHDYQPVTKRLPVYSLTLQWPSLLSLQVPRQVTHQLVQAAVKPVNGILKVIVSPLQKQLHHVSHLQQQQPLIGQFLCQFFKIHITGVREDGVVFQDML